MAVAGRTESGSSSSSGAKWVKKIHASSPWLDSSEELDSGQSSGSEANDVQRSLITQDHENGTCQPCVFFASTWGCKLASRCDFCHLQHSNKNLAGNIRPQRRERAKTKEKILDLLKSFQQQLQEEVRENHYVRKEVIHFLNGHWNADWNERPATRGSPSTESS